MTRVLHPQTTQMASDGSANGKPRRIAVLLGDDPALMPESSLLASLPWVRLSLNQAPQEQESQTLILTQLLDEAAKEIGQGQQVEMSARIADQELRLHLLDDLTAAKLGLHVHGYLAGWAAAGGCDDRDKDAAHAQALSRALAMARRSAGQTLQHDVQTDSLPEEYSALYRAIQALAQRSLKALKSTHGAGNWTETGYWFSPQHQARVLCLKLKRHDECQSLVLSQGSRLAAPRPLLDENRLFIPLCGNDMTALQSKLAYVKTRLDALYSDAAAEPDTEVNALLQLMASRLQEYDPKAPLALVLMAQSGAALAQEVLAMQAALTSGKHQFKTPAGSSFCASPLGDAGLAFVYPGVGSVYANMFADLHHYFPALYARLEQQGDLSAMLQAGSIYHADPNTAADHRAQMSLSQQAIAGVGASFLFTRLMTEAFGLRPRFALGYSMGEAAMWASLDVWQSPHRLIEATQKSHIFNDAITGELTAVRRAWHLNADEPIVWNSFLVRCDAKDIMAVIADFPRAYLAITQGDSCVLAGCEADCLALLARLGRRGIASNLVTAMHTPPSMQVHDELQAFYTLALKPEPVKSEALKPEPVRSESVKADAVEPAASQSGAIRFISASQPNPVARDSASIARSIADTFCAPLDFGALVRRAHTQGARLFLELGADRQVSTLIDKILKQDQSPQAQALAIDTRGADTATSLLKCLARLICHRVPVSLAPLMTGLTWDLTTRDNRQGEHQKTNNARPIPAPATASLAATTTPSAQGEPL